MQSPHDKLNELSILMELRLAFGPGTRLWAYRSREELCYDWLHFKARRADASFKEFALVLYAQEREYGLHCASLSAIRRGRRHGLESSSGSQTVPRPAGHRRHAAGGRWPGSAARSRPANGSDSCDHGGSDGVSGRRSFSTETERGGSLTLARKASHLDCGSDLTDEAVQLTRAGVSIGGRRAAGRDRIVAVSNRACGRRSRAT